LAFLLQKQYPETKKKEDRKFTPFADGVIKFYAASMACGLQAIHDAGYVYRDLKPQNVLLDGEGQVRISDMGLTANVSKGPIKQCSGTRGFWSPETIEKKPYTFEPDWWSLGVTMYCLFSDKLPFKGKGDEEKDAATVAAVIEYTHGEPDDLQAIISALCTKDQTKRLGTNGGLEEVKKHPYFSGFDWVQLINGDMEALVKPNVNDINAPSKSEIAAFTKPKDVDWTAEDQQAFKDWPYFDKDLWFKEAIGRAKNWKEIPTVAGEGGGGGGCCTIA
jgi:serine/threonine protein kinase